jgi:hypothetical protein
VLVAAVAVEGESEKDLEAGVAEVRQRVLPSCVLSSHPYLMDTVLKLLLMPWVCFPCGGFPNPSSFPAARVRAAERGPPHRPREDGLTHPAATPRTNLAAAFGLLSRHSKPLFQPARGWRAAGCAAYLFNTRCAEPTGVVGQEGELADSEVPDLAPQLPETYQPELIAAYFAANRGQVGDLHPVRKWTWWAYTGGGNALAFKLPQVVHQAVSLNTVPCYARHRGNSACITIQIQPEC